MDRRTFLRAGLGLAGAAALGPELLRRAAAAAPAVPGPNPYGALAAAPDANGLLLPPGFTSRIVAVAGQKPVSSAASAWHKDPDGGAVFAMADGGWVYASNQENRTDPLGGGVGALRFDRNGNIVDSYRILGGFKDTGTNCNCAGGPTPWGTWLSCEETAQGQVWECDPTKPSEGVARPAMGMFWHEAVCVDPVRKCLYMTEDAFTGEDGRFYRFTPNTYPDLSNGKLEAAKAANDDGTGTVTWIMLDASKPITYAEARGATAYAGAEGVWYHNGIVYFTTKGGRRGPDGKAATFKDKVFRFDPVTSKIDILFDGASAGSPLTGVDNCVVSKAGELFVAEEGGNMELVLVAPTGVVAPFLRLPGDEHEFSEISGPAFDPSGTRLYFSSMRPGGTDADKLGGVGGITYEVRGPFRTAVAGTGTGITSTSAVVQAAGRTTATEPAAELPATGGPTGLAVLGALAGAAASAAVALGRAAAVTDADDGVYEAT